MFTHGGKSHGWDHDDLVNMVLYVLACGSQSLKTLTAPGHCCFEDFCPMAILYFIVEGNGYVIIDSQ